MSRTKYDRENFDIERLRTAVAWAEAEALKDEQGDLSAWQQMTWAEGPATSRVRKPKTIAGQPAAEYVDEGVLVEVKCGSAYCVAGYACAAEGDKFLALSWSEDGFTPGNLVTADYVIPKGSREAFEVSDRARELFGITEEEADELFEGWNTIKDVKRIARKIARRRGETL